MKSMIAGRPHITILICLYITFSVMQKWYLLWACYGQLCFPLCSAAFSWMCFLARQWQWKPESCAWSSQSNIWASLGLSGCDIWIAQGCTLEYNKVQMADYITHQRNHQKCGAGETHHFVLKARHLHAIFNSRPAVQIIIICMTWMIHMNEN